jgi:SAM-dependent methyltransferase
MSISPEIKQQVLQRAQGALSLQVAFVGIASGLLAALKGGPLAAGELAGAAGQDPGYVARWADAAYAFELLDRGEAGYALTELGRAFLPDTPGTLMPVAFQAALSAHMAERALALMPSGERPGEVVLGEKQTLMPWFGPMLEASFRPMFEGEVLPAVPFFKELGERGGVAVDVGCGNGWYLRALLRCCPTLRGVGLDLFAENIEGARALAAAEGVADRLEVQQGDVNHFTVAEPVDLIALNRALHHIWGEAGHALRALAAHLAPGGALVIWEPRWPEQPEALRAPPYRPLAFQNLAEHIQGNRFLTRAEVEGVLQDAGLTTEVYTFLADREMIVVGRRLG